MSNSINTLNDAKQALVEAESALENAMENEKRSIAQQQLRIAELAHEVRTPLNALIGYAQIMSEQLIGPLGKPEYIDYAKTIHHAAFHLLQICDGMLSEFNPEEQQKANISEDVDANVAIDTVIDLFAGMAKERGITLEGSTEANFPKLKTDPTRLNQILINLVSNAIKFTQKGGSVNVAARVDEKKGAVILVIQDNGKGMSEAEMIDRLEPFSKGNDPAPHGDKGSGLGLAIAHRIIGELQGQIYISSAEGKGTIVSIELPVSGENPNPPVLEERIKTRKANNDEFSPFMS
jgi:two-component system cell cycle sensor histidine kinase PleC